uniref:Uncharacterized protein n=1 Tax=Kalanchoe fedtschenkoi TaxID=63787 RepID=A0A7N0T001_KALFE
MKRSGALKDGQDYYSIVPMTFDEFIALRATIDLLLGLGVFIHEGLTFNSSNCLIGSLSMSALDDYW